MKKYASTIIFIIIFFVGLSVLLYPTLSDYYNSFHESRAVANYEVMVSELSENEYVRYRQAAEAYNDKLRTKPRKFYSGEPVDEEYRTILDIAGNGMMGYINIQKLNLRLPIYHGSSEAVLAAGTGHLEGSSLPVGGIGTHTVITGHRGLPTAKLFTNLDKMESGDTFELNVLGERMMYRVDSIAIVEPNDDTLLEIDPESDLCTLITCTPYAINTHRLLIRGIREDVMEQVRVPADALQIDPVLVVPFAAAPMLFAWLVMLLIGTPGRRKRKRKTKTTGRLASERMKENEEENI